METAANINARIVSIHKASGMIYARESASRAKKKLFTGARRVFMQISNGASRLAVPGDLQQSVFHGIRVVMAFQGKFQRQLLANFIAEL